MKLIHDKLGSAFLRERIIWAIVLFIILFFSCVIFGYYVLPEGILKGKNPLQNWETSQNVAISTLQIFSFNLISVLVIIAAGMFGQKKTYHKNYFSIGYVAFFSLICLNGIVLGTWSFSVESVSVPLFARFLRTFDLAHRAGLWEMLGQLLIACATAHISIILTNGKQTDTKKIRSIRLLKSEWLVIVLGIFFMIVGAVVESIAINSIR